MRLAKYLRPDAVLTGVVVSGKEDLFRRLATAVAGDPELLAAGYNVEQVVAAIQGREQLGNTGIGNGFAFPHARLPRLNDLVIGLAILDSDFDYGSFDHKPISVACLILAPEKKPTAALKAVAQIAKLFSQPESSAQLHRASDSRQVISFFAQADEMSSDALTAQDIMRRPELAIDPMMPIRDVTTLMADLKLNYAPVVDDFGRILGEVSCDALFQLGVPEAFTTMKNVGFVCDFDPFEKYFADESMIVAKDALADSFCKMSPNATLLEVVFALTVQKYPCVYVVDEEDRLLGCIDDTQMLNRVINI